MTDMNNSPWIIVNTSFDPSISNIILSNVTKDWNNACLSIDSMTKLNHDSSSSHSSGHGDRKIIYIDLYFLIAHRAAATDTQWMIFKE